MLERELKAITGRAGKDTVLKALDHSRCQMVISKRHTGEAPFPVGSHFTGQSPFAELRARHKPIGTITISMGIFVTKTGIPEHFAAVTGMVEAI